VVGPGAQWFDRAGRSIVGDGETGFYKDADHLSSPGVEKLMRPLLEPVFDAMADHQGKIDSGRAG
jgi:hypothetical protein